MLVFTTHYCYYIHELLSIVQPIYVVLFFFLCGDGLECLKIFSC